MRSSRSAAKVSISAPESAQIYANRNRLLHRQTHVSSKDQTFHCTTFTNGRRCTWYVLLHRIGSFSSWPLYQDAVF